MGEDQSLSWAKKNEAGADAVEEQNNKISNCSANI